MRFQGIRSTAFASILSAAVLALAPHASATPVTYYIDAGSIAFVGVRIDGEYLGTGILNITGSHITFDEAAPLLSDLEITGSSATTITLSQQIDVGLGLVDSIFVDSATLTDLGAFLTTGPHGLAPSLFYQSSGPIHVDSDLTTNLGPQSFPFDNDFFGNNIQLMTDGNILNLDMYGLVFAAFPELDSLGAATGRMLTVDLTLILSASTLAATLVPEPSAGPLYLSALALVAPFVRKSQRAAA